MRAIDYLLNNTKEKPTAAKLVVAVETYDLNQDFLDYAGVSRSFNVRLFAPDIWIGNKGVNNGQARRS